MTDSEAIQVLAHLSAAWPNNDMNDATTELWIETLRGLHFDDASHAAKALAMEARFFPSIAEFIDRTANFRDRRADAVGPDPRALDSGVDTYRCARCEDHGFIDVTEDYVARFPEDQRAAARNTVYPCSECRPEQYEKWAKGGYRSRIPTRKDDPNATGHTAAKENFAKLQSQLANVVKRA